MFGQAEEGPARGRRRKYFRAGRWAMLERAERLVSSRMTGKPRQDGQRRPPPPHPPPTDPGFARLYLLRGVLITSNRGLRIAHAQRARSLSGTSLRDVRARNASHPRGPPASHADAPSVSCWRGVNLWTPIFCRSANCRRGSVASERRASTRKCNRNPRHTKGCQSEKCRDE